MATAIGSPYPADEFPLDEYLPAVQMRSETRGGCSCLLQSRCSTMDAAVAIVVVLFYEYCKLNMGVTY